MNEPRIFRNVSVMLMAETVKIGCTDDTEIVVACASETDARALLEIISRAVFITIE